MNKRNILRGTLLCIGLVLLLNALSLIMQKKIHLGIFLPFLIGIIFITHGLFWTRIQYFLQQRRKLRIVWICLWIGFIFWLVSFIVFAWTLQKTISQPLPTLSPIKAIIVLGSGIEGDQPTPTLASRLDTAGRIAIQQPSSIIVVSGGIGFSKKISEAEVMSNYLDTRYQIATDRIFLEKESTSTELNLHNSIPILKEQYISQSDQIAIVTSDFHILRSKAIATKQGYSNTVMIGAPTPLAIRYNAWLREYFAFISGWVLQEY